MVPASGKQFRGGPALDRDRRCRRAAWEFPRWSVPLGGTRMKRSKSRAVMVVGACVSNVWSLWCGSPGMLRPARGSPTPTERMFAPFRRLLPACPVVTNDQSAARWWRGNLQPWASVEGSAASRRKGLSAVGIEHGGSATPRHEEDCRQRRARSPGGVLPCRLACRAGSDAAAVVVVDPRGTGR